MFATIILGLATIASAIITGAVSSKKNKKARDEAMGLAETQRSDELKMQGQANKFAKNEIALGNKKLAFDEKMLQSKIGLQRQQEQYETNKANTSKLRGSVQSLFKPKDEDWMYKGNMIGRFA